MMVIYALSIGPKISGAVDVSILDQDTYKATKIMQSFLIQ